MAVLDISINETRILNALWMDPGLSRIALSRELNLNKSTVTKIVNGLLYEGIIHLAESPEIMQSKGRRPTGLFLCDDLGVVLGIEMQTDYWTAIALSPGGKVQKTFVARGVDSERELLENIKSAIDHCLKELERESLRVLGIAIGLPGQINPYKGIILSSNPLNITEPLGLSEKLEQIYPYPVMIENDANCCCWSVIQEKKKEHPRNFLCILGEFRRTGIGPENGSQEIRGVAIGMGLVIKGSVLHGDNFSTGEFQSLFKSNLNPTQFDLEQEEVEVLQADSSVQRKVLAELARNTSLVINILNVSMIKIFGSFIKDPEDVKNLFLGEVKKNWPYQSSPNCSVEIAEHKEISVAMGAAGYFLYRMFSLPDLRNDIVIGPNWGVELLRRVLAI